MGRAWDSSAGHRSSVDDAASLQQPETAAAFEARSGACFFNRVQVCWSAPMGAARKDEGQ